MRHGNRAEKRKDGAPEGLAECQKWRGREGDGDEGEGTLAY